MQNQTASRFRNLALLSVSALALSSAGVVAQTGGGFLIEAPAARPAAPPVVRPVAPPAPSPNPSAFAPRAVRTSPAITPVEGDERGPDETALRYYAGLNQKARVNAEAARLRKLYPHWRAPEDLYEPVAASGEDEQALWDLFGADRIDELRIAITERERAEPGWKPSAELSRKIESKALRLRILALWKQGRLDDVLNIVRTEGKGDQADIELRWTIAEVNARMKKTSEAVSLYREILDSASAPNDRLATIHKAMDNLRITDVEPLIAQARLDGAGRSEFEPIAVDITRARISAFLHDERAEPIPPAEFRRFEDYARGVKDSNQSGLVAWHHYKTKGFRDALEWFKLALERGGDAMIAHGLAHSLRELGMNLEAEEVAFAWREPLINNAILFIDVLERDLTKQVPPFIEPERLHRYGQVTMDMASGEGAQALAWYAYNSCQYDVAYEWFQRAVAWYPKEATVYGLALSSRKAKKKDFYDIVNRYDGLFPKVLETVFPDGYQRPPSPCDLIASGAVSRRAANSPLAAQPQAAWSRPMNGAPSSPAAARHPGWNGQGAAQAVPGSAQGLGSGAYGQQDYAWGLQPLAPGEDKLPKLGRNEFPVAVNPENPLRFSASGKLMGRPSTIAATSMVALAGFAPEPWRGQQQLVARRVPGVAAMPYERWGFALLPGGNGLQAPDAPHSAAKAPAGTLWAVEQATGSGANQVGAAGALADPSQAAAQLLGMGKVPPPAVMRIGGQGYFRAAEADMEDEEDSTFPRASMRPTFAGVDVDPAPTGSIAPDAITPRAHAPVSVAPVQPMSIDHPDFEPGYSTHFLPAPLAQGEGTDDHSALEPMISDALAEKAAQIFKDRRSLVRTGSGRQAVSELEAVDEATSVAPSAALPASPAAAPAPSPSILGQ